MHFGTHFTEKFRMSKCSWMMNPSRSREMSSFSATDLAGRSFKISLWIFSTIYGVLILYVRPGRGATQVEKLQRFRWATHFLTAEYNGEFPLMFLSEWREIPSTPCLVRKKNMRIRVLMLLKSRTLPNILPFSICNKIRLAIRHMGRTLFPATLSIPSYDIGK